MTVTVTVTAYTVTAVTNPLYEGIYDIRVEQVPDTGKWAVRRMNHALSKKGNWDWENLPSNREDDWLAEHRFDLDTALRLAREAAPDITVNNLPARQAQSAEAHP
jgi:hypothetical protein